jgi:hypothetical protein
MASFNGSKTIIATSVRFNGYVDCLVLEKFRRSFDSGYLYLNETTFITLQSDGIFWQ